MDCSVTLRKYDSSITFEVDILDLQTALHKVQNLESARLVERNGKKSKDWKKPQKART